MVLDLKFTCAKKRLKISQPIIILMMLNANQVYTERKCNMDFDCENNLPSCRTYVQTDLSDVQFKVQYD